MSIATTLFITFLSISFAQFYILDRNEFALTKTNTTRTEKFDGYLIGTNYYDGIIEITNNLKKIDCSDKSILWLGNSQQHTINEYSEGEHLSIYWLANQLKQKGYMPGCIIGISLPNINPQEILYLLEYFENQNINFNTIILPLEFMGYREFSVRDTVITGLEQNISLESDKQINKNFSKNIEPLNKWKSAINPSWLEDINNFIIDKPLKNISLLESRLNIQSTFVMSLVILRNRIFGISSSSKRKAIPERMRTNIVAFESTIDFVIKKNVNPIFYFVPILEHQVFPYHRKEFELWKKELNNIITENGYSVADLIQLIDKKYWGSNFENDIDFMHFGGHGHRILANKINELISVGEK